MSIRAIIVDDEPLGRERMRMLLEKVDDIEIVAECDGGVAAVEQIAALKPGIVFLDIQMPDLDGFGVIDRLHRRGDALPLIIFVTAYNEYAVKAFEVHAFDYLLKPVQKVRLVQAVDRARDQLTKPVAGVAGGEEQLDRLAKLLLDVQAPAKSTFLKRLEVRSQGRIDYVDIDDVLWLEADRNYIEVHTANKMYLARMTMTELEAKLDPAKFVRISRSSLVMLSCVKSIKSVGRRDHVVELTTGAELALTRPLKELQERMQFPG
ncbi:MAG: two-component system LytT family response regulator [Verrucomicrobiales bacterium]|jgi:two-component system LytT family response regulator